MTRKFLNYSLLLFSFFLVGVFVIYFSKVYFLKEPIIIDSYFSKNKKKIQSFLANKINIYENQIIIEDVGLEINDLQNFLSIKITNLEIISELNETILKSNKINIKLSLLDLIEGLTDNQLLLKNIFIDKIHFEFLKNQDSKIINSSFLNFLRRVDHNNSNFFKDLKINQFNFKFLDQDSILKNNLLFECKSLNFDVLSNKEHFFLKCFETKTNSGVIIKNFNYDKNDIFIDGYFEKFNLRLLKFKNYFKELNFDGELNSYFKINLNSNLNIKKINFKILKDSSIIKKAHEKINQFKLGGLGSFDFEKKKLIIKNFVVNNYSLNGSIVENGSKLKNNIKISFDKKKFDQSDFNLYKAFVQKLFIKNKNFINFDNKFSLKNLKSEILINSIFDIESQEFKNIYLSSKGYYSLFINDKEIDDFLNVNANLNGFYDLKYENNEFDLKVSGKFEKVKIKFIKLDEIYDLSEIDYSINYNNDKLTINKLNFINKGNRAMEVESTLLRNNKNFNFMDLKVNIFDIPAKYFAHFYSMRIKEDSLSFTIDTGKIVNSKIYISNKKNATESTNKNIEILDLNFENISINNYSIKFENLNLTKKTDKVFIGNSKVFIKNIPLNTSFEVDKNGFIRAFGSINFNQDLKSLINKNTDFKIENLNLLKFETEGNLNDKSFDIRVRSTLKNASFSQKVLNLNASNIKKGFVDLNLVFRNGTLKKINNLLIIYDNNEFKSDIDFQQTNLFKISNIYSKNFIAKSILVQKENDKLNIKIDGKMVDISHLTNDLINQNKIKDIDVKFDVVSNKIILNDKFSLSGNLTGTYKNKKFSSLAKGKIILGLNTLLDAGQLTILVENGKYLITGRGSLNSGKTKVKIISSSEGLPNVTFESEEGGKLLSALGFTKKIKSGEIKLKINFLNKNLSKYQGFINAKKFRVIDAPKIVKSLSSLSFSGINSLFVGEGVGFSLGDAKFKKVGNDLKFEKILINNQTLSIYLEGDYNLNSEIINFTGSIVPFTIVSKFISVVPAVGELLTGSNKKGVISGQFKLNGKVSDPEIDINILSFSPGILRQIFSKDWLKESEY